jgi:hypothetical protein
MENLKKSEFSQQSLAYLGYLIDAGELKIDLENMEATMKWLVTTNVTKFRIFFGNHNT